MGAPAAEQLSLPDFDEAAETSLRETTFVVVDLETTGGRMTAGAGAVADAITEIGAVKVRGGAVLGEFATLVDPQRSIPPQIVQLTGITTAMVCDAPTIDAVLPMFLEFARGAVLVAHNARFDVGFLRAAAERCGIGWRRPQVLCTVALATAVEHVECAHALEAGVRELRMLGAHAPPYNRRSRFPHRWWWVVLSDESFPRFTGVRTCTKRLARSALHGPACPLHEVSPCPASRDATAGQYAATAAGAAALIDGLDNTALAAAVRQVGELAERQRYESAARLRDHTVAAVEVLWR